MKELHTEMDRWAGSPRKERGMKGKKRRKAMERAKKGAKAAVRVCDDCQRGYVYCNPFDEDYEGECPRRHSGGV